MPDLTEDPTPPAAAIPPTIDPAHFEDYPVLRETFLAYVADPTANATLRGLGELLHSLILEYWRFWPDQPEGLLRSNLRAVVADMRYLQGFLTEWAEPETDYKSPLRSISGRWAGRSPASSASRPTAWRRSSACGEGRRSQWDGTRNPPTRRGPPPT